MIEAFFNHASLFILIYFLLVNSVYTLLFFFGSLSVFKRNKYLDEELIQSSHALPKIVFVIAMYNEEENIVSTLENLLKLKGPQKEIIVVDDGSIDGSLALLKKKYHLVKIPIFYESHLKTAKILGHYQSKSHPDLIVLSKEHAGKFDALNAGINACREPFFIGIDADTILDEKAYLHLIQPLYEASNIIAIGAGVRIKNGCKVDFNQISTRGFPYKLLPAFQTSEYLSSFLTRQGWNYLGGTFVIAGAFSVLSKQCVVEAGGFLPSSGEDMEMIVRLHRVMKEKKRDYKILYFPDPVAWTEAPSTLKELGKQRTRWHLGLLQTFWMHKKMFFNPHYGLFGMIAFPFSFWGEAIEPIVEFFAMILIITGFFFELLNPSFLLLLLLVSFGFSFLYSLGCLFVEELSFKRFPSAKTIICLILINLIENVGYRQLTVFWRLRAFIPFLKTANKLSPARSNLYRQESSLSSELKAPFSTYPQSDKLFWKR